MSRAAWFRGGGRRMPAQGVDELFRDVQPIESINDLAAPGLFGSDEELDKFLAWVRAERNANLAGHDSGCFRRQAQQDQL